MLSSFSPFHLKERLMRRLFGTLVCVETDEPTVALTFDDGPHPTYTSKLLDVLRRHEVRATFFMVGRYAQNHPRLVRRAYEEGHDVGNHTFSHAVLPELPSRERRQEIRACQRELGARATALFRPPFGAQSTASRIDTWWAGAKEVVGWSALLEDWKPFRKETLARRLRDAIEPGAIILMHDRVAAYENEEGLDRSPLIGAVDTVLEETKEKVTYLPVTELIRYGRPHYVNWREALPREKQKRLVHAARPSSHSSATPAG